MTMHPNAFPTYRPDVDGLRAVAVLSVVAFHGFPHWVPGGFVGVDIFFVISGFLISSIIFKSMTDGGFSFADFYARRAKRIFPALILVAAFGLAFGWFALFPDEFKQLGKHVFGGSAFVVNFMFWREDGYFDTAAELKPMLHLWSLGIEEQYYLLWPMFVILASRGHINLALFLLVVGGMSFAINIIRVEDSPVEAFFLPHARFWELMVGSLLAFLATSVADGHGLHSVKRWILGAGPWQDSSFARRWKDLQSWTGIVLLAAGFIMIDASSAFPGWWALFPTAGSFLAIAAGRDAMANRLILSSRPMVAVGLISYPLYLWHWPLLSFVRILESGEPSAELRFGAVTMSALLATATYQLVEKPIRFGRRSFWMPVALAAALGIVGASGLQIFRQNGFPDRLDPATKAFMPAPTETTGCRAIFPFATGHCLATPGNPEGRAWILSLGDSHSGALAPGLLNSFPGDPTKSGVIAIGKGGCLPFKGVDEQKGGCQPLTDLALQIPERTRVSHIILHARWASKSSEQAGFGEIERSKPTFRYTLARDFPPVDRMNNAEVFRVGLDRTLAHLESFNVPILLVHQVPELGVDPRSCLRPFNFGKERPKVCGVARSAVDERQRQYRKIVAEVLASHPKVAVFDPLPIFCDAVTCTNTSGLIQLYRDDDHLSADGAEILAARIFTTMKIDGRSRN